jgi:hypothetical protein
MPANEQQPEELSAFALKAIEHRALNAAVRNLAGLVNDHTVLLLGLCKKLQTTPEELVALVKPEDFLEPAEGSRIIS